MKGVWRLPRTALQAHVLDIPSLVGMPARGPPTPRWGTEQMNHQHPRPPACPISGHGDVILADAGTEGLLIIPDPTLFLTPLRKDVKICGTCLPVPLRPSSPLCRQVLECPCSVSDLRVSPLPSPQPTMLLFHSSSR